METGFNVFKSVLVVAERVLKLLTDFYAATASTREIAHRADEEA
jgi:hypothetical protein